MQKTASTPSLKKKKKKPSPSTFLPKPFRGGTITTAYAVFEKVFQLVKEEPLRMDMGVFVENGKARQKHVGVNQNSYGPKWGRTPKCNTVGCLSGWAAHVVKEPQPNCYSDASPMAITLGLDNEQVQELFHPVRLVEPGQPFNRSIIGPKAHAEAVLKHLATFMEANEAQLKAKEIVIPKGRKGKRYV